MAKASSPLTTISSVRVRYGPRRIVITDGHEAEAEAAQSRRPPNPIGRWLLRMLGFRGEVVRAPTDHPGRSGPSHEHPVRHEHPTTGE